MGKIIIHSETTKTPITLIGKMAGVCWGGDTEDDKKNYNRGISCINSKHGRTFEFPDVYMTLEGYSARVIREWYTHIGGAPTRLQASTRYIDYSKFDYVTPKSIKNNKDNMPLVLFNQVIDLIQKNMKILEELNIPREDIGMLLPLCMTTTVVDKRNLRNIIDMSRQRMCTRAYYEFRELFNDLIKALSEYSEEWKILAETLLHPKCEDYGYCTEDKGCGRYEKLQVDNLKKI